MLLVYRRTPLAHVHAVFDAQREQHVQRLGEPDGQFVGSVNLDLEVLDRVQKVELLLVWLQQSRGQLGILEGYAHIGRPNACPSIGLFRFRSGNSAPESCREALIPAVKLFSFNRARNSGYRHAETRSSFSSAMRVAVNRSFANIIEPFQNRKPPY